MPPPIMTGGPTGNVFMPPPRRQGDGGTNAAIIAQIMAQQYQSQQNRQAQMMMAMMQDARKRDELGLTLEDRGKERRQERELAEIQRTFMTGLEGQRQTHAFGLHTTGLSHARGIADESNKLARELAGTQLDATLAGFTSREAQEVTRATSAEAVAETAATGQLDVTKETLKPTVKALELQAAANEKLAASRELTAALPTAVGGATAGFQDTIDANQSEHDAFLDEATEAQRSILRQLQMRAFTEPSGFLEKNFPGYKGESAEEATREILETAFASDDEATRVGAVDAARQLRGILKDKLKGDFPIDRFNRRLFGPTHDTLRELLDSDRAVKVRDVKTTRARKLRDDRRALEAQARAAAREIRGRLPSAATARGLSALSVLEGQPVPQPAPGGPLVPAGNGNLDALLQMAGQQPAVNDMRQMLPGGMLPVGNSMYMGP